jgi:ribosomal-protein-alanine N-acetyltransferase
MDQTEDSPPDSRLPARLPQRHLRQLLTARLTLRPIRQTDFPIVLAIFSHPATTAHRPDPRPETEPECRERVDRYLDHWADHGFGLWTLDHAGASIGIGGLTYRDGFSGLNLSYHMLPDHWRKGFASELAAAAVDIAFQDLQATRVIGLVRPVNLASRRVLEKTGLTLAREIVYGGHPGLLYVKRLRTS